MNYKLRPWHINDLDNLVLYANNPKIARNLTDQFPHPYRREDGKRFIENVAQGAGNYVFAVEIDGKAAGGIGLHPLSDVFRLNAELGYWLAEPYWGKGIMTLAIKEIVNWGFENLEITRIFARPYGSNPASHRVLQKAGFQLEAKFEQTLIKNNVLEDEYVYGVRKG
jgi:RimJ/RimL family protein N-acetyltransferase